jgi:hypothetical protein
MIFEFLLNSYTFSLIAELLLVPIVAVVTMLEVLVGSSEENKAIRKLVIGIQMVVGLIIIANAAMNAISGYKDLGNIDTLRSFLLAPLLSILIIPFIYFIALYAAYDQLFIRLELGSEKCKKLMSYVKRKIFLHCKLRLKKVRAALNMRVYNLMSIQDYDDVEDMLRVYKEKI